MAHEAGQPRRAAGRWIVGAPDRAAPVVPRRTSAAPAAFPAGAARRRGRAAERRSGPGSGCNPGARARPPPRRGVACLGEQRANGALGGLLAWIVHAQPKDGPLHRVRQHAVRHGELDLVAGRGVVAGRFRRRPERLPANADAQPVHPGPVQVRAIVEPVPGGEGGEREPASRRQPGIEGEEPVAGGGADLDPVDGGDIGVDRFRLRGRPPAPAMRATAITPRNPRPIRRSGRAGSPTAGAVLVGQGRDGSRRMTTWVSDSSMARNPSRS